MSHYGLKVEWPVTLCSLSFILALLSAFVVLISPRSVGLSVMKGGWGGVGGPPRDVNVHFYCNYIVAKNGSDIRPKHLSMAVYYCNQLISNVFLCIALFGTIK